MKQTKEKKKDRKIWQVLYFPGPCKSLNKLLENTWEIHIAKTSIELAKTIWTY